MGEVTNSANVEKAPKRNLLKGLKSEFKKIVWPDKESLAKQSVAVISVSAVLGIIIFVLDKVINFGIGKLLGQG